MIIGDQNRQELSSLRPQHRGELRLTVHLGFRLTNGTAGITTRRLLIILRSMIIILRSMILQRIAFQNLLNSFVQNAAGSVSDSVGMASTPRTIVDGFLRYRHDNLQFHFRTCRKRSRPHPEFEDKKPPQPTTHPAFSDPISPLSELCRVKPHR